MVVAHRLFFPLDFALTRDSLRERAAIFGVALRFRGLCLRRFAFAALAGGRASHPTPWLVAIRREVAFPKIDQNALVRFGRVAPKFSRRDSNRIKMLRILAKSMRIRIRKDVCAVMGGDNAVLIPRIAGKTGVAVRIQVPRHDAIANCETRLSPNLTRHRISGPQEIAGMFAAIAGTSRRGTGRAGFAKNCLHLASISSGESVPTSVSTFSSVPSIRW